MSSPGGQDDSLPRHDRHSLLVHMSDQAAEWVALLLTRPVLQTILTVELSLKIIDKGSESSSGQDAAYETKLAAFVTE